MSNLSVQKLTSNTFRTTKLQLFMAYAQNDINIWRLAVGLQLVNRIYGVGRITEVEQRSKGIFISINFQSDPTPLPDRKFIMEALADSTYFLDIRLPDNWLADDFILRLQEKQTLLKNLKEHFKKSFFNADNWYQANCSQYIYFDEYKLEKTSYIQSWVQQHLSSTVDPEQAEAIGAPVV